MRRIDRKGLRAPARVLDLELLPVSKFGQDALAVEQYDTIWCLSRMRGIPQEISFWDVTDDTDVSLRDLRDTLRAGRTVDDWVGQAPPPQAASLDATVVICTRDRPAGLRATLASLRLQTDSNFRVLVVDNGSGGGESAKVVEQLDLPNCDYAIESRPGLARARNRALEIVRTDLVAWIDDDEVADSGWVQPAKGRLYARSPACGRLWRDAPRRVGIRGAGKVRTVWRIQQGTRHSSGDLAKRRFIGDQPALPFARVRPWGEHGLPD